MNNNIDGMIAWPNIFRNDYNILEIGFEQEVGNHISIVIRCAFNVADNNIIGYGDMNNNYRAIMFGVQFNKPY